jgi:chorismate mutase-like protein
MSEPLKTPGTTPPLETSALETLAHCRVQIDAIDVRLLELINERTAIVEEIGRVKQHLSLAVYEPKREDQVFANVLAHNHGPLSPEAVKRIFERIIDEMRTVQKVNMQSPPEKESC